MAASVSKGSLSLYGEASLFVASRLDVSTLAEAGASNARNPTYTSPAGALPSTDDMTVGVLAIVDVSVCIRLQWICL